MKGYMYILECTDSSYYTGSTKDIELRLQQHKNGEGANHTKKHLPVKLVYFEEFDHIDDAFYREKQVQGWSRNKKEALINNLPEKLHEYARCMNETAFDYALAESETGAETATESGVNSDRCLSGVEGKENGASATLSHLVPQLRFPEFEGDWTNEPLREYINLISGFAFKGDDIVEDNTGIPLLRGINITEGYIRHNKDIDRYYIRDTSGLEKYFLLENDLVLGMDGSKVGKNVALIGANDVGSLLIQRVARIRANDNSNINYLYQNIFSKKFQRYVDTVNTSSGIPHISSKQINDFKIGFPSKPEEQTRIATFLTTVDKRITLLQKKKAELEQYKKRVMQKLFCTDVQSERLRFKDENGNDFPDWEEKKLGEVAKFSKGKGISKADIEENGAIECIRYGQLYTDYNEVIEIIYSKTNHQKNDLVLSEKYDVIIPASGETQIDIATASCVMKSGVALGGDLNIIKTNVNGIFLSFYLNNAKKHEIASLSQGISVVHLYSSQLKKLEINIPSLPEQQKIASFLSSIDKKIEKTGQQIEASQLWKQGLLQKMFV